MPDFNASLLREKFVIHDPNKSPASKSEPVTAVSNRMVLELKSSAGKNNETFIIRTQNMHSCVRMAARLMSTYHSTGPILNRLVPFDWESAWDAIINDYEYAFNPKRWVTIYHNGKIIFSSGEHHPFLDVIEKCDAQNDDDYEEAIPLAESAFKKTGKIVKIEYEGNVALVVNFEKKSARCAIILRVAGRTTTFNFMTRSRDNALNYPQCLAAAAAFLEGIQLCFIVGMNKEKIRLGVIDRHSRNEKQYEEAKRRLSQLSNEISNLEGTFEVRYRPEKPDFTRAVNEAEILAHKILSSSSDAYID